MKTTITYRYDPYCSYPYKAEISDEEITVFGLSKDSYKDAKKDGLDGLEKERHRVAMAKCGGGIIPDSETISF